MKVKTWVKMEIQRYDVKIFGLAWHTEQSQTNLRGNPIYYDMRPISFLIPQGSGFSMEKLRQYQLNRLKYYYAVMDCDSPGMA